MRLSLIAGLAAIIVPLASCSTDEPVKMSTRTHARPGTERLVAYQPVEFPMPPESDVDRDGTNVVGNRRHWYGTLAVSTHSSLDEAQLFYSAELAKEGWEPLSSLIGNRVILQFVNRHLGRACIVIIDSKEIMGGSDIQIIVAPLVT